MESPSLSGDALKKAVQNESIAFEKSLLWLESHMPKSFLELVNTDTRLVIARQLLSFALQDHFSPIYFKHKIITLSLDAPNADLMVLGKYQNLGIRYYRAFVSNEPPPGETGNLRIAILYFYDLSKKEPLSESQKREIRSLIQEKMPKLQKEEIEDLISHLTANFLRSMKGERLSLALEMFFRAKSREQCQYEMIRNENWQETDAPSLQLVMAWRNVPKAGFLFHLAEIIYEHGLSMQKLVGIYIDISPKDTVLILSLGLHGIHGKAAWEEGDIPDFLREMALLKYLDTKDVIHDRFVHPKLLTGNEAHLVRNVISFAHQALVQVDPNLYSFENVQEGFLRHPELTVQLCKIFAAKFDPEQWDEAKYLELNKATLELIDDLDTGQSANDFRRKNIFKMGCHFIEHTLKTNFYRRNKSAFSFRLNPKYLDEIPFKRQEKFPELPFAIFFVRGMHFIGFHIRFKDLARGGVRTVITEKMEQYFLERINIFSECYNLAFTQQKKNKDIPEGGAKTVILLAPFEVFTEEEAIYQKELAAEGLDPKEKMAAFRAAHRLAFLQDSQSSFIEAFLTLINCNDDGTLKAKSVVDYWKKPEYIYLGPDENMSNEMITWIANFSEQHGYKPGKAFMTSKPGIGINHKEFGVTSFGVNVYLHQVLLFLGINPEKNVFTVKISGGPDGDVAGNEILNLHKFYPKTAKLLALTDVSGTIFDPEGLDLGEMAQLFHKGLPIRNYPAEKLSNGGFLLDVKTKREESAFATVTLCLRKKNNKIVEEWLSGNEMNHLYRNNVHQTKVDVFIPAGGRPKTLNENNFHTFLDEKGKPTSRAIVEGANLYLTNGARKELEKLGVLIVKDSSCNKGGVICSSFEVLAGLCMSESDFLQNKKTYVQEVLEIIGKAAFNEANLLLKTYEKTGRFLTDISEQISEKINLFKYQLLDYFEKNTLSKDLKDPLVQCLLRYCPRLLREKYLQGILNMPEIHKKAIVSCYIASHLVYEKGLDWSPSLPDILSGVARELIG